MSEFDLVEKFNYEILGIAPRTKALQTLDEFDLSVHQLYEEIDELRDAYHSHDYVGCIDALIDLKVFTDGVLYKLGLTSDEAEKCFEAVMYANMKKKKGVKEGREGYDAADATKPGGWIPPEDRISEILCKSNG